MNCLILAAANARLAHPPAVIIHELLMDIQGPNNVSNRGYSTPKGNSLGTGGAMGSVDNTSFFSATIAAIINKSENDVIRFEVYPMAAGQAIGEIKSIIIGGEEYNLYARSGNPFSNSYGFHFRGTAGKFPPNGNGISVKFT